jgi:hypothetical protein
VEKISILNILGAHYLPLPNKADQELLDFLEEAIIQGYDHEGFPIFDAQQLTFAPDERLFYRNTRKVWCQKKETRR